MLAELTLLVLWARMLASCALGLAWGWRRRRAAAPLAPDPRVSVVVPAFDEAAVIEGTLRALLDHRPAPWEIVVVDDGSRDGTAAIARRVLGGSARAQVIRLPANAGKAAALNAGVRATRGGIVATVDADTRLQPGALAAALAALRRERADAVAFVLEPDAPRSLLARLQRQEYLASLNFERAGQDLVGAIAVLPGAATLFRRELLLRHPFSGRTRTEDADLTLALQRDGARLVLAGDAVASTLVPETGSELLAQRVRWTTGHLQCSLRHAAGLRRGGWRFRALVWPNFVLSTWMTPLGLAALLALAAGGRGGLLGLDAWDAARISMVLVLLQRAAAWLAAGRGRVPWHHLLVEPLLTSVVGSASFAVALWGLVRRRGR